MAERQTTWGRSLAQLRQWASDTEGVSLCPSSLSVAAPVRQAFYDQVDEVADLLAAEVLGERLPQAGRLARALGDGREELLAASGLGAYRLPERLEHFLTDAHRALAEPLSSLVVDAASGRVPLAEVHGRAASEAARSADVLMRCAYEAWVYLGIMAALRPVRFWAVASEDGRRLVAVPTDEVRMGWQVPSRELRHPEAVFETADGRVFACKCEAAREIDYYDVMAPPARDTSAGGNTENLMGRRVLLLYQLDGVRDVRPLVDRKEKRQVAADHVCTVLSPGEMGSPSHLGAFISRLRTLRTRRPVTVLAYEGPAAFPAEMAEDAQVPPVEFKAVGLSLDALAAVAAPLAPDYE